MISLGVQAGDKAADRAMSPHYLELRKLLAECCKGTFGSGVREFAPVLRIDGSIWHWDREGFDYPQYQRRSQLASVDVFVPRSIWQGNDVAQIRTYLATTLRAALAALAELLLHEGTALDRDALMASVDTALHQFLGAVPRH